MNESNLHLNSYGIRGFAENKKSNRKKPVFRISHMHGTGNSSTRTLKINRECEPMSAKNIDVTDSPDSANTILKHLRFKNVNRLICAQLNINSIRNKFESLKEIVRTNVDILLICETKLDSSSFPRAQFHIHGFGEPYRFDRNGKGGGILLYIRDDIPSKLTESKMTIEGLFVEINLRKKKWLLCCSYNPKKSLISNHLREIGNNLDLLSSKFDNYLLMGDFNLEPNEPAISDFCEICNTKNIIKEKTCFKNPENPTCIDLILTNRPRSFQDSTVVERGLSDFHKMCVTVMKMYHCKQRLSVITYRKFKNFSNIEFMKDLEEHLTKFEHFNNIPSNLFKETVNTILEKHAPTKKKYVRANQAPFKTLSKEIMKRSRLRNKFLNTKSDIDRKVYNKQRNYVVSLLRKGKRIAMVILISVK